MGNAGNGIEKRRGGIGKRRGGIEKRREREWETPGMGLGKGQGKRPCTMCRAFGKVPGGYLSSRAVSSQVLSAYEGLTAVFGMGTGGAPQLNHRKSPVPEYLENRIPFIRFDQALDLLVSVSFMRCRTSTPDLSTLSSARGLTSFRNGRSYLEVGFTLRCLQRLSDPHMATQLCRWHDN